MKKFLLCLAFVGLVGFAAPQTAEAARANSATMMCDGETGRTVTISKDSKGRTHLTIKNEDGTVVYQD